MAAQDYETLSGPQAAEDNMGGLTQRAYYAPIRDFLSIKKPTASPAGLADLVEIATAHTFKTGKCFTQIYCTMDKGKFDAASQGDTDGKSFKLSGEIFYPGSLKEAHGFAAQVKNDSFILELEHPDSTENGYLQAGTEMFPAKIDPEFTTATNSGGVKGYTFKFSAMSPRVFVYTSTISLTPAS